MAGFIRYIVKEGITHGPKFVKYIAGRGAAAAPVILKPAGDFARGALKGGPKYIAVGEGTGVTTATVTASVRAGMQARYITREVGKAVIFKGPATAVNGVKFIAQTAAKDAKVGYDYLYFGYKIATMGRNARFLSSRAETGIEAFFRTGNKFFDKFGIAPSLRGFAGANARIAAYISIGKGIDIIGDRVDVIYTTARKYLEQAREASVIVRPPVGPTDSGDSHRFIKVGGDAPVGNPPVVPQPVPPPTPPVPTVQSRSRQYIPTGGR